MISTMARCGIVMLLASLAPLAQCAEPEPTTLPGLSVSNGVLVLNGTPYQGIGANYFSLFSRILKNPADKSYEDGLRQLSGLGIPFVRFMACGFWPIDWDLYLRDKNAYFELLDRVVHAAEKHKVGLIASLFWNMSAVPDIVGEPMDCLGDPHSKTTSFIRQYTAEIVSRYKNSRAVWGWEFGNEYNLHADLPGGSSHRPAVWPGLKTATKRTERDELSSLAMLTAFGEMAKTVRNYDTHRIIITGNAVPRASAYHNTSEKSWTKDSVEQWRSVLLRDNPDPFNTISAHVYPEKQGDYPIGAGSLPDLIAAIQRFSLEAKKPLFIGEFGAPATQPSTDAERATFTEMLAAIETNSVPLSAFWVFDLAAQHEDWNVTFTNSRAYMLHLVGMANSRMQTTPKKEGIAHPKPEGDGKPAP